jgi:hypothetical protein
MRAKSISFAFCDVEKVADAGFWAAAWLQKQLAITKSVLLLFHFPKWCVPTLFI